MRESIDWNLNRAWEHISTALELSESCESEYGKQFGKELRELLESISNALGIASEAGLANLD